MGISWNVILSGCLSELYTETRPWTDQSQNRDFLFIDQKMVSVLDVAHAPVRATSGAISFMTGTYQDRDNCQHIGTRYEAETHTM